MIRSQFRWWPAITEVSEASVKHNAVGVQGNQIALQVFGRLLPQFLYTRVIECCLGVQEDKIAVQVGTITDDARLFEVPKLRICALRFTETARARILKVRPLRFCQCTSVHPAPTAASATVGVWTPLAAPVISTGGLLHYCQRMSLQPASLGGTCLGDCRQCGQNMQPW